MLTLFGRNVEARFAKVKNSNHICKEMYLDSIIEGRRTGDGMNGWFREGRWRQEGSLGECQSFKWAQLDSMKLGGDLNDVLD